MNDDHEAAIRFAKKFTEDILSFFGANVDVYATASDDEVIELHVPSTSLNSFLIGVRAETMRALQFMVSSALRNQNFTLNRVNLDIADYKRQRAERLVERTAGWIKEVQVSGQALDLRPMNAADRRIVHQTVAEAGLISESVGEGRERHVVLKFSKEP